MSKTSSGLFNRRFQVDIIQTTVVQVCSIAAFTILLVLVLPHYVSKAEVGMYIAFRALIATLYPLFTFALDITQARYLGYHTGDREKQRSITPTVMASFLILSSLSCAFLLLIKSYLINHFLEGDATIFYALLTGLISTGMFRMVYTYFQGNKRMIWANRLQAIVAVGGHLSAAALIIVGVLDSLHKVLWFIALIPGIAFIPFLHILLTHSFKHFQFKKVLTYALPRVPHLFTAGFLMSSAIILATYFYSGSVVGDVGISTRLFQLIEILAYAFNMVLLPGVSELWGMGRKTELTESFRLYTHWVVYAGIATTFIFYAMGPIAIRFLLPAQYLSAIPLVRILSFATLPYMVYAMFQHAIHGVDKRPVHLLVDSIRLLVLIAFFVGMRAFFPKNPGIVVSVAFSASYFSAGIVSYWYIKSRLELAGRWGVWIGHALTILSLIVLSRSSMAVGIFLFTLTELWFWKNTIRIMDGIEK
jgi:O-antigen/teichoic acid export membrane protein